MKKQSFLIRAFFLLILIDGALIAAHFTLRQSLGFFDLDKEGSLKAVFSGFQLLTSGVAAGWIAVMSSRLRASRPFVWLWSVLSALFVYLAFDDMMMIHERVGFVLNRWTGLHGTYESFNWLLYFTPLILIGICAYLLAVRALFLIDVKTRIFAVCGVAGLVLTILAEAGGGALLKAGNIPLYHLSIIFEESLLLIGETFFLAALLMAAHSLFLRTFALRESEQWDGANLVSLIRISAKR